MRYYSCINKHYYKTEGQNLIFCGNCKDILLRVPWPILIIGDTIIVAIVYFIIFLFWTDLLGLYLNIIRIIPIDAVQEMSTLIFDNRWITFFIIVPITAYFTLSRKFRNEIEEFVEV